MNHDSQTRMTNDEIRRNDQIPNDETGERTAQSISTFGLRISFVIRHSSFNDSCKSGSWSQCALKIASGLSMNLPLPRELPRRARGPRPVPGRSVWAAPAPLEDHSRPGLCAAAAGGDRPRSESDRFMVLMHAQSERGLPMNRDSETRMTNDEIPRNDEIRRTKPATAQLRAIGHSGFGFLSSLVIGHWSFNDFCNSGSWSQCMRKNERGLPMNYELALV